jgi:hypothetical protein
MNPKIPQQPNRGAASGGGGKASKTLAMWLMFILAAVLMVQVAGGKSSSSPGISYTRFREELDKGNIKQVEVWDGTKIKGTFHNSILIEGKPSPQTAFSLDLPVKDSES